ncbi:MAG: phosphopantetheine-binding protein [Parvibaculaceae bacterium]
MQSTDRRNVDYERPEIARAHLTLSVPYAEPVGPTELALAQMWSEVLQIDQVGRDDDFFEIGGDSYAATVLASQIEHAFSIQFSPADFIAHATIRQQAQAAESGQGASAAAQLPSFVIACRPEGKLRPIFFVHGARGFTFFNRTFLDALGSEQPVYLFQAPGMDGRMKPLTTVPEYAAAYIGAMRMVQPNGPYLLATSCAGSLIGLEICHQLDKAGESIDILTLIDPSIVPTALAHLYPAVAKKKSRFWGAAHVSFKRLRLALGNFVHGKGFTYDPAAADWRDELKRVNKVHDRVAKKVARRKAKGETVAHPAELTYSADDILKASLALHEALRTYIPTPYHGHAHMLLNETWAQHYLRNDLFWKTHLASFDYELCPGTHQDIFDKHVLHTAAFIKKCLARRTAPSPV